MAINPATITAALEAAKIGHALGTKYLPTFKKGINHLFSTKNRQSARNYFQGLKTSAGINKLITKDIPSVVKKGVGLVKSGKILKGAAEVAADVGKAAGAIEGVTGPNKYTSGAVQLANKGVSGVQSYHQAAENLIQGVSPNRNRLRR